LDPASQCPVTIDILQNRSNDCLQDRRAANVFLDPAKRITGSLLPKTITKESPGDLEIVFAAKATGLQRIVLQSTGKMVVLDYAGGTQLHNWTC